MCKFVCFGEYNLYPASDKMKHIRPECIYSGLLGLEGLLSEIIGSGFRLVKPAQMRRKCVLEPAHEEKVVNYLLQCCDRGYGKNRT